MVFGRLLSACLVLVDFKRCHGWQCQWQSQSQRQSRRFYRYRYISKLPSVVPKISEAHTDQASSSLIPTTILLNVSFDGGRFTGWTSQNELNHTIDSNTTHRPLSVRAQRRSKEPRGFVRSVEGVLQFNLAKLFGGIDAKRVIIEGCSRTDKGVHAQSMICQIYCLSQDYDPNDLSIPGKRIPHPRSTYDTSCFLPFPKSTTLLLSILNRMCPDDVNIRGIMPTPTKPQGLPFHPTLDCIGKTYEYALSVGPIHDPTKWRRTWHLDYTTTFDVDAIQEVCKLLEGSHDFVAFRGAPRGKDEKQRQETGNTICTLRRVELHIESQETKFPDLKPPLMQYTLVVEGDRFVYKMMRFIVGALVAVGTHKLSIDSVVMALKTGEWDTEGTFECAPPHGLVLKNAHYDETIQLDWET